MPPLPDSVLSAYADDAEMAPETIATLPSADQEYFNQLLRLKLDLAKELFSTGVILDVGCANGVHLNYALAGKARGIGIDITGRYLERAHQMFPELDFMQADVCSMPIASDSLDGIYSFSCLYQVPNFALAAQEMFRVLKPGAHALLDIGNYKSINYRLSIEVGGEDFVQRITHNQQVRQLKKAGFEIVSKRYFQVLPYWGSAAGMKKLFVNSYWKMLMQRRIGKRMLDEVVSSLPLVRKYAFRCIVLCKKGQA